MTYPAKTFELKVSFVDADTARRRKDDVRNWLVSKGVESFVDGYIDGLYLDHDYDTPNWDPFSDMGGEDTPLLIYKYDYEYLQSLGHQLQQVFGKDVICEYGAMDTETWTEGWKESFRPIQTKRFLVYPPWEQPEVDQKLLRMVIEPGMAFGTGQHATTQLCLEVLEEVLPKYVKGAFLDVGTGTGLLAIGACQMGLSRVVATDIDGDAVRAAKENARVNHVKFDVYESSFPGAPYEHEAFDVIVANILAVVLRKLLPEMAKRLSPGGVLLISGLLIEDEAEFIERGQKLGLQTIEQRHRDDWSALLYQRPL